MSEFPNPCPGGGVYADDPTCPACRRGVAVAGGRWVDHSLDAFLVLGFPRCGECGEDIADDAVMQDGEYVHPWCFCTGCARHRFVDAEDARAS